MLPIRALQHFRTHPKMARRFPDINSILHEPCCSRVAKRVRACTRYAGGSAREGPRAFDAMNATPLVANDMNGFSSVDLSPPTKQPVKLLTDPHWGRPLARILSFSEPAPPHQSRVEVNPVPPKSKYCT